MLSVAPAAQAVPQSASKTLVSQFKHVSQEFKQKYDKSDPLRDILKSDTRTGQHESATKKGAGASASSSSTTVTLAATTTRGKTQSAKPVITVESIEDDESEEGDDDEDDEDDDDGLVEVEVEEHAAAATPTASSTLNRLKNVLDDVSVFSLLFFLLL